MDERVKKNAKLVFNLSQKKDKAWAKKVGLQKTAGKPMQGPYYWVWLKPNWVLKAYPLPGETDSMDHPVYWEAIIDISIAPHYKITDPKKIARLKNAPYCMPRGRVVAIKDLSGVRRWIIYNGNDMGMNDTRKKAIIEAFSLGEQFHAGLVRFALDEHEVMLPEDQSVAKAILNSPSPSGKK